MPSEIEAAAGLAPVDRIVEFVNTRRADGDGLGTPEQLTSWLHTHDLLPPSAQADADGRERAVWLREGLRALLAENNAEPVTSPRPDGLDPAARTQLATLTAALPLRLDVTSAPPRLVAQPREPVDHALATLLADVATAVAAGTWPRLKACREPSCRWAFYDHSRNHGRTWCSMNVCGNRVKVRASQRRRAGG
ncbi:CGNR zinc finger domain-containing protein [Nocardia suismassiliense]|uniref:CGNR zinc finger domain-containing protein n=1 Tax=Nocardia suismassiliense TaxID=2077092 RepID=A0ABW6QQA5_9NOCA